MTTAFDLDGPRYGPASGQAPKQLVVLLHGLGADGDDLISLAPYLAQVLPEAAFVSPHAPFPCDMAPFGRQWFSLQERTPEIMLGGVRMAAPILDGFLDAELEKAGLTAERLALVGFSQGTMMALHVGLRRAAAPSAIVGFSGALLAPELLPGEIVSRPPVVLIHGAADEVVPAQSPAGRGCGAGGEPGSGDPGAPPRSGSLHRRARPATRHGLPGGGFGGRAVRMIQVLVFLDELWVETAGRIKWASDTAPRTSTRRCARRDGGLLRNGAFPG